MIVPSKSRNAGQGRRRVLIAPGRYFRWYLGIVSLFAAILLYAQFHRIHDEILEKSQIVIPKIDDAPQQNNSNKDDNSIIPHEDDDPFALSRGQSFGFFYDITADHWKLWQRIYMEHENHRYPDKPLTMNPRAKSHQADPEMFAQRKARWFSSDAAWYQNNYEPNFSCPFEMRVGIPMNGDGPKWVCDPHRITKLAKARKQDDPEHPGCVIYSVGSNGDFSFELGMQKAVGDGVCEFHIFDMGDYSHTVPAELQRAHYHRWGLEKQQPPQMSGLRPLAGKEFYGLLDTVKMLGHEKLDVIDVFKIDCETCEFVTYKDWLSDEIPMLHQIQVEVHKAPVAEDAGALDMFNSLERAGYLRFHKEPNIQFCPDCIEYAFVKVEKEFMEGKILV